MEKANKMGVMPIKKVLILMGIPMIISMALQAVYNIVDSAFVSNMPDMGEQAFNALTLAFPMQMLMVAIAIGTGVGVNAVLSKSLGQGDSEKAGYAAGNSLFLGAIIYVIFLIFGFTCVPFYISTQTSDPIIAQMAESYLKICCVLSVGIVFFSMYEKLLQATGRTLFSTIAQISGAVANIILDPIMIYGLCGCPALGIEGAAYATVIGQIISLIVAAIFHYTLNKEVKNGFKFLRPRLKLIGEIYSVGLPAIIAQALMSVMTYGMNVILGIMGEEYVNAYGLYYKIQQFVLFCAFGLRDAITPLVSFNYGAKNKQRVRDGIKFGLIYTIIIMAVGTIAIEVAAAPLASVFGFADENSRLCISCMRIVSASLVFAGVCVALQGIFQALGSGLPSLIISICRQLLFVLPVAYGFVCLVKYSQSPDYIVWLTFILSETVSVIIAAIMMKRVYKKKISNL